MAFGLNRVELIGRLGADVTVNHLTSGGRIANLSIAADESYLNKQDRREGRPDRAATSLPIRSQEWLMFRRRLPFSLPGLTQELPDTRLGRPRSPAERYARPALIVPQTAFSFANPAR